MSQRDMILVERVTDGEKCGNRCPQRVYHDDNHGTEYGTCGVFGDEPIGNWSSTMMRCPTCFATPSAVVLTDEIVEAVTCCASGLELAYDAVSKGLYDEALLHLGHHAAKLRAAFPQIEGGVK